MRINGAITAPELRVIDSDGNQIGILSHKQALLEAEKAGLDLVEISPDANPPVARIVDWGKFLYQKTKEQQRNKRNTRVIEIKQMRLGLKISAHDLDIKLRKIREFLEAGHKVKVMAFFRGREMAHQQLGYQLLEKIIDRVQDIAVVEQRPIMTGKNLGIVLRSTINAKAQNTQGHSQTHND